MYENKIASKSLKKQERFPPPPQFFLSPCNYSKQAGRKLEGLFLGESDGGRLRNNENRWVKSKSANSPEINPHIYGQMIFHKGVKTIQ